MERPSQPVLVAVVLLLAVLGVLGVVLGGADDSPGLQGLGGLLLIGAVVLVVRGAGTSRRGQ